MYVDPMHMEAHTCASARLQKHAYIHPCALHIGENGKISDLLDGRDYFGSFCEISHSKMEEGDEERRGRRVMTGKGRGEGKGHTERQRERI